MASPTDRTELHKELVEVKRLLVELTEHKIQNNALIQDLVGEINELKQGLVKANEERENRPKKVYDGSIIHHLMFKHVLYGADGKLTPLFY